MFLWRHSVLYCEFHWPSIHYPIFEDITLPSAAIEEALEDFLKQQSKNRKVEPDVEKAMRKFANDTVP